jgi:hypothetical protein
MVVKDIKKTLQKSLNLLNDHLLVKTNNLLY